MKEYVKPDVYYEDYELSIHIATCAWDMSNYKDKENCSAEADLEFLQSPDLKDQTLFTAEPNCSITTDMYQDYCYTNGDSGMNVFNS